MKSNPIDKNKLRSKNLSVVLQKSLLGLVTVVSLGCGLMTTAIAQTSNTYEDYQQEKRGSPKILKIGFILLNSLGTQSIKLYDPNSKINTDYQLSSFSHGITPLQNSFSLANVDNPYVISRDMNHVNYFQPTQATWFSKYLTEQKLIIDEVSADPQKFFKVQKLGYLTRFKNYLTGGKSDYEKAEIYRQHIRSTKNRDWYVYDDSALESFSFFWNTIRIDQSKNSPEAQLLRQQRQEKKGLLSSAKDYVYYVWDFLKHLDSQIQIGPKGVACQLLPLFELDLSKDEQVKKVFLIGTYHDVGYEKLLSKPVIDLLFLDKDSLLITERETDAFGYRKQESIKHCNEFILQSEKDDDKWKIDDLDFTTIKQFKEKPQMILNIKQKYYPALSTIKNNEFLKDKIGEDTPLWLFFSKINSLQKVDLEKAKMCVYYSAQTLSNLLSPGFEYSLMQSFKMQGLSAGLETKDSAESALLPSDSLEKMGIGIWLLNQLSSFKEENALKAYFIDRGNSYKFNKYSFEQLLDKPNTEDTVTRNKSWVNSFYKLLTENNKKTFLVMVGIEHLKGLKLKDDVSFIQLIQANAHSKGYNIESQHVIGDGVLKHDFQTVLDNHTTTGDLMHWLFNDGDRLLIV